ncbi:MAG: HNH endonuclease [Pseudomonadales bacterium]|nr:HNH endonuclease [Pseudomonadales bacterium]
MKANTPEDIWSRVQINSESECWPYIGSTFSGRYGRFFVNGRAVLAHRQVYEMTNGSVPDGLFVMHKCNNKLCCNPSHLTVGTNSENQRHASVSGAFEAGRSNIRGVGFDKARNYWVARAYLNGKAYNLYTGPNKAKAIKARRLWEEKHGIYFEV